MWSPDIMHTIFVLYIMIVLYNVNILYMYIIISYHLVQMKFGCNKISSFYPDWDYFLDPELIFKIIFAFETNKFTLLELKT